MINPVSAANSAAVTTTQNASSQASGQMFANGDFETFLKMLTTQIKNQDPLNPMEGSDFAVQLATFSGVEQQAHTNKLLTQMTGQISGGLNQLTGWIGKEARTTAPVWFGNSPLTLNIQPDPRADAVTLRTLDANGREITREEIGTGKGQIDWFGRDALGNRLPEGAYSFRIESWQNGEVIAEDAVSAYGKIIEAEMTSGGMKLVFEGGGRASADEIDALRDPA